MSDSKQTDKPLVDEGVHTYGREEEWIEPGEPLLRERLEWFRDQKLGIFMHFGLYSQIGSIESWPLSDDGSCWTYADLTWDDPKECQRQYKRLNRSFNPIRFRPDEWADISKECGFKYFILTTKHHDGFCLWDTSQTQYKVTGEACPFAEHKYADICRHAFNAFRDKGLAISAYFSKADWNSSCYWAPELQEGKPTSNRVNYSIKEHPELWEKFVHYTHAQVMELVEDYGPIDVLWLDAGWVNAAHGEDIKLGLLAEKARKIQPGLLFADRTVGGPLENILTPECTVPEKPMNVPWESCITLDKKGWGYKFEHDYMTSRELVHLLIEIVSKGGNLALGVGPQPDGRLAAEAVDILEGMGAWLRVYGEAIYGTRICEPYSEGQWSFTKKGDVCYAIRRINTDESVDKIDWTIPFKQGVKGIEEVGFNKEVEFEIIETGVRLKTMTGLLEGTLPIAVVFRMHVQAYI
jgi:alpha-L-fucosidase